MDQVGAFGPGRVVGMDFVGDGRPRVAPLPVGGAFFLLLVDLRGKKDTGGWPENISGGEMEGKGGGQGRLGQCSWSVGRRLDPRRR